MTHPDVLVAANDPWDGLEQGLEPWPDEYLALATDLKRTTEFSLQGLPNIQGNVLVNRLLGGRVDYALTLEPQVSAAIDQLWDRLRPDESIDAVPDGARDPPHGVALDVAVAAALNGFLALGRFLDAEVSALDAGQRAALPEMVGMSGSSEVAEDADEKSQQRLPFPIANWLVEFGVDQLGKDPRLATRVGQGLLAGRRPAHSDPSEVWAISDILMRAARAPAHLDLVQRHLRINLDERAPHRNLLLASTALEETAQDVAMLNYARP